VDPGKTSLKFEVLPQICHRFIVVSERSRPRAEKRGGQVSHDCYDVRQVLR
jgi:hypothetical protein